MVNGFNLAFFATQFAQRVGRQIVDRTGLPGEWSFEMTFAPPPPQGPPSLSMGRGTAPLLSFSFMQPL